MRSIFKKFTCQNMKYTYIPLKELKAKAYIFHKIYELIDSYILYQKHDTHDWYLFSLVAWKIHLIQTCQRNVYQERERREHMAIFKKSKKNWYVVVITWWFTSLSIHAFCRICTVVKKPPEVPLLVCIICTLARVLSSLADIVINPFEPRAVKVARTLVAENIILCKYNQTCIKQSLFMSIKMTVQER